MSAPDEWPASVRKWPASVRPPQDGLQSWEEMTPEQQVAFADASRLFNDALRQQAQRELDASEQPPWQAGTPNT